MEQLWKYLMQANAKALFVIALAVLIGVLAWRGWVEYTAATAEQAPVEQAIGRAEFKPGKDLGLIGFVTNQLAATPEIPLNPFRPTLESLASNPVAIATMGLRGWGKVRGKGDTPPENGAKDHFAHLRGDRNVPGKTPPPAGQPVTPRLTYKGFFKRPDGQTAALFHDSATQTSLFIVPGGAIRDATLLEADIRHAKLRLADGEEVALDLNASVDLEPAKP